MIKMNKASDYNEGDQVVFGDKMEPGFVMSQNGRTVYCRFWSSTNLGSLRSLSQSEACDPKHLNKTENRVPDYIVKCWLHFIKEELYKPSTIRPWFKSSSLDAATDKIL